MSSTIEREVQAQTQQAPVPSQSTAVEKWDGEPMGSISVFASAANYEAAKRMATALASSTIVPSAYRNSAANCLIALELANRTRTSVMMVMQNVHVIEGKPGWSSAFLIASVNSCGRFSPLRFEWGGQEGADDWKCRAVARDLASGEVLEGEWITWKMVKAEGWLGRKGSKWQTIPGQMFRYRSAAFWCRAYAPELSLGMHTSDEIIDITGRADVSAGARDLNAALATVAAPSATEETVDAEIVSEERSAPLVCGICGRSDGTHDPEQACYGD